MKLQYLLVVLAVAGSLWTPRSGEIDPSELARIKTGSTSYEEIERWWGRGKLVGSSGRYCGAIRSQYQLEDERQLELSWERGVVCDWTVVPNVAAPPIRIESTDRSRVG
jgi:hypothetical protein